MNSDNVLTVLEWVFMTYALGITAGYLVLLMNAAFTVLHHRLQKGKEDVLRASKLEQEGITIISPAYNEEDSILGAVTSLLRLNYAPFEIIVVNDGSRDRTLDRLIENFDLEQVPLIRGEAIKATPPRACYQSRVYKNLRVLDKPNGGKADALNAGINLANFDIICSVDADSMLDPDSLGHIVQPLLKDPSTIAVGGMVRVMNGCKVEQGQIHTMGLPTNVLALFQVIEYTKAFLYGRLGWLPLKAILLISGAFGVFRKSILIEIGGYRRDTIGEDMELIVRMHRIMSQRCRPYRIDFDANAICWTECPEDIRSLRNQRIRWQRGLGESLINNVPLLFSRTGGAAGWIAFPFLLIFELFGPAIEIFGIALILIAHSLGFMTLHIVLSFLLLVLGLSMAVSAFALLIDEFHDHQQRSLGEMFFLFLIIILETVIYRQIANFWRTIGLLKWLSGSESTWGTIKRQGLTTIARPS